MLCTFTGELHIIIIVTKGTKLELKHKSAVHVFILQRNPCFPWSRFLFESTKKTIV